MERTEIVSHVVDGNTFRTAGRRRFVRLANVEAAPFGTEQGMIAQSLLVGLIQGRPVRIRKIRTDRAGRTVAEVTVGDRSVNQVMASVLRDA